VGARFSAPDQTGPGAHPACCTMGTGSFLGVKSGRGVMLTLHPLLVPSSRKGGAIPLLPLMGHTACTEPQCLYKGCTLLYLYCGHGEIVPVPIAHSFSVCATENDLSHSFYFKVPLKGLVALSTLWSILPRLFRRIQ